jgi:hypothetical protein
MQILSYESEVGTRCCCPSESCVIRTTTNNSYMFILIHRVNIGATSAPPEDSGIKGATDGLARAFQEELMEKQGHAQK